MQICISREIKNFRFLLLLGKTLKSIIYTEKELLFFLKRKKVFDSDLSSEKIKYQNHDISE